MEEKKPLKKIIRNIIIGFFAVFIIISGSSLFYFKWSLKTSVSEDKKFVLFEVKKGESGSEISNRLYEKNLIRSKWIFLINLRIKEGSLMPGIYDLSPSMNVLDIYNKLTTGQTKIVKVTIPEGYRREQIAQELADKEIVSLDNFLTASKDLEGQLFPDTYYLSPDNTVEEIIKLMTDNYSAQIEGSTVTTEDLVIASIVEREAVKDEERPIIAGIYKNRMKKNMKLEADPTVQYGKDSSKFSLSSTDKVNYKFWQPITKADYSSVVSDYNTYKISGLPPTPICNPGIKSIRATQNPASHDYLYFFQTNGEIYLSKTFLEHTQKIAQYLR